MRVTKRLLAVLGTTISVIGTSIVNASGAEDRLLETKCPISGIVIVSDYDESILGNEQVQVLAHNLGSHESLLRQHFQGVAVRPYKIPKLEMPLALQRGVADIAVYKCDYLLDDPKGFFDLFKELNVWVLVEDANGSAQLHPTVVADYLN